MSTTSLQPEAQVSKRFTRDGLCLGFIFGIFIQLSSMGASFLLSNYFSKNNEGRIEATKPHIVIFSLSWSILTSSIGLLILLCVRSLVVRGWNKDPILFRRSPQDALIYLQSFVSTGALVGVCMAWTCADLVMGYYANFQNSLFLLAAALVWCKVIAVFVDKAENEEEYVEDEEIGDDDLSKPLLVPQGQDLANTTKLDQRFQMISLIVGLLVGFLLQTSVLGSTFILKAFNRYSSTISLKSMSALHFSMAWSLATSLLSVGVLLVLRSITINSRVGESSIRLLVYIEGFYSFGAMTGVNLAWIITNQYLGLDLQIWQALYSVAFSILCCRIMTFVYNYKESEAVDVLDEISII